MRMRPNAYGIRRDQARKVYDCAISALPGPWLLLMYGKPKDREVFFLSSRKKAMDEFITTDDDPLSTPDHPP
jgi:hypothetical protein